MGEEDKVNWLERTIRGVPRYIILFYILTIALICLLAFLGMIITAKYQIGAEKGYEIFRDLLTIILAIAGITIAALGYAIYLRILKRAEISMKEREDVFIHYSTALLFLDLGYFHWQHYEIDDKIERGRGKQGGSYALNHMEFAIDLTEGAYEKVQMLDVSDRRNEKLKCQIMNNLGYYLATRGEEKDRELSKRCAYYIMKRIEKFPDKREDWQGTFDHIIEKYGSANQFELEYFD